MKQNIVEKISTLTKDLVGPVLHPYADRVKQMELVGEELVPAQGPHVVVSRYVNEVEDPLFLSAAMRSITDTKVRYMRYPTVDDEEKCLRTKVQDYFGGVMYHRPSDVRKEDEMVKSMRQIQNREALYVLEHTLADGGSVILFPQGESRTHTRPPFAQALFSWAFDVQNRIGKEISFVPAAVQYGENASVHFGEPTRYNGGGIRGLVNRCEERVGTLLA